jgi:hypothetical protein
VYNNVEEASKTMGILTMVNWCWFTKGQQKNPAPKKKKKKKKSLWKGVGVLK